jgi:hypothetical protein
MTARVKSGLLLGLMLLIGVVLGMVINARMADRRFERVGYFRSQQGFARHLEEIIHPTDDAQRSKVEAILEEAAARMRTHMDSSVAEGRRIMDSTRAELAKVLTQDQLERLDKEMRSHREMGPGAGRRGMGMHRRGPNGTPPGMPPDPDATPFGR